MNTLSFCTKSCCSNLKQPQSGINMRIQAWASVGAGDAGGAGGAVGAGGAGGVCRWDF